MTPPGLPVRRYPDASAASLAIADEITALVRGADRLVLGLAAGQTPLPVYAELVRRHRAEGLSFAHVHTVALDEFVDAPAAHTFRGRLGEALLDHLDVAPGRAHFPPLTHPEAYDALIRDLDGVDLQLLGLGHNGHIAFNEPGSELGSCTRRVTLSETTRRANAAGFPPEVPVPTHAVTMGIATILRARRIRLMAFGAGKADVVAELLTTAPTRRLPASFLRGHAGARLVVDDDALGGWCRNGSRAIAREVEPDRSSGT